MGSLGCPSSPPPRPPKGPVANLWHNLEEVIRSMGCVTELQVNHSRHLWRVTTVPLRAVMEDMVVRGGWGGGEGMWGWGMWGCGGGMGV